MKNLIALSLIGVALTACPGAPGPSGPQGPAGQDGASCSVTAVPGGANIVCGTNPPVFVPAGAAGPQGIPGINGTSCTAEAVPGGANITCGTNPPIFIANGTAGTPGANGQDGKSARLVQLAFPVDRSLPFETSNGTVVGVTGVVILPWSFTINAIISTTGGPGWIDVRVEGTSGRQVACYQRVINSKRFDFVYRKTPGVTTGCDSNSDQDGDMASPNLTVEAGETLRVIPREPKLAGIVPTFRFQVIGIAP